MTTDSSGSWRTPFRPDTVSSGSTGGSRASDRAVREAELANLCWIENIAPVENHGVLQQLLHLREIGFAELVPFRDDQHGIGAGQRVVRRICELDTVPED